MQSFCFIILVLFKDLFYFLKLQENLKKIKPIPLISSNSLTFKVVYFSKYYLVLEILLKSIILFQVFSISLFLLNLIIILTL